MSSPLLVVENLRIGFSTESGLFTAVDGVDLTLDRGEALGLVGESGSGKSVTALSLLRLIPTPPAKLLGGTAHFDGESLLDASLDRIRRIRGGRIGMIFQDPMTSLNPMMSIGAQVAESARLHRGDGRREAWERAVAALAEVGIPDPSIRAKDYPHQFSGGMRQRAMIAMAIVCEPDLLIADEPTTALDVTVQAEILDLLQGLRERRGMALLLITHDLGVVAEVCDDVAVMYAGKIVEQAPASRLFGSPQHPYTIGLLESTPDLDAPAGAPFRPIPGAPPRPGEIIGGCPFHPRCPVALPVCATEAPAVVRVGEADVRCHLARP